MNLAFISYSHHDVKVAEWLQKNLEHFYLPSNMPNPVNPQSHYLRPIFRDRTDLSTGVLSEVIDKNLENSKYLIVICSRRAARSEWVSKEVQYFIDHDRMNQIIPFVIDGIPYSGSTRECIPKYMRDYIAEHPEKELLCIDRVADGDSRAFMQVVSRLMDVPFDVMYGRHRRRRIHLMSGQLALAGLLVGGAGYFMTPITPYIQLNDTMSPLPHEDGTLVVDGQLYTILKTNYDTLFELPSMPGYLRGSDLEVLFYAKYYDTIHVTMNLGYSFSAETTLKLRRDNSYAIYAGIVLSEDGTPIHGAIVKLAGQQVNTDFAGNFRILIPAERQSEEQSILIIKDGYKEFYRGDEQPGENKYILHPEED